LCAIYEKFSKQKEIHSLSRAANREGSGYSSPDIASHLDRSASQTISLHFAKKPAKISQDKEDRETERSSIFSEAVSSQFLEEKGCLPKFSGSCHKRQKPKAPTPQSPIRNCQTRKVTNAKGLKRNTNLI